MIDLKEKNDSIINYDKLNLIKFNRLLEENNKYLLGILKDVMKKSIKEDSYMKLLNSISTYSVLVQCDDQLLENYYNLINKVGILSLEEFKTHFDKVLNIKMNVKERTLKRITNNKDENILAYILKTNNKELLFVCNLLNRNNLFSFDCCEEIRPSVIISNYKNSEVEIDELNLRAYESIIYEF